MTNKEKYQQAFSVLKASRQINMEDMVMNRKNSLKKGIMVAAAFALCFVGSNSICYAATGATWVEKMVVYLNDVPTEMDVVVSKQGDGEYSYLIETEVTEDASVKVGLVTNEKGETIVTDAMPEAITTEVVEKDGRQLFYFDDRCIDITESLLSGEAKGTVTCDGKEYNYSVSGGAGSYNIEVELCE